MATVRNLPRPQRSSKRFAPKLLGWTIVLLCPAYGLGLLDDRIGDSNAEGTPSDHPARLGRRTIAVGNEVESGAEELPNQHAATGRPNFVLMGMSSSDATVSDAARELLAGAACRHGVRSHVLLAKGGDANATNSTNSTSATLLAEAIPADGDCRDYVRVEVVPDKEDKQLIGMTRAFHGALRRDHDPSYNLRNWRYENARVQRELTYSRKVREMLTTSRGDLIAGSAIVMLDLEMVEYPRLSHLVETASELSRTKNWQKFQQLNHDLEYAWNSFVVDEV
ncbi:hypothetical protein ACHAWF_017827 [Thalassiosira exigua]